METVSFNKELHNVVQYFIGFEYNLKLVFENYNPFKTILQIVQSFLDDAIPIILETFSPFQISKDKAYQP